MNSGRIIGIEEIGWWEDFGIYVLSGWIIILVIVWSIFSDLIEIIIVVKDGVIFEKNSWGVVIVRFGFCVEDFLGFDFGVV